MKDTLRRPTISRSSTRRPTISLIARPKIVRPVLDRTIAVERSSRSVADPVESLTSLPLDEIEPPSFEVDPYEDYQLVLTREGGIAVTYKTIDDGFGQALARVMFWTVASGLEAMLLLLHSPVQTQWINVVALVVAAIVNLIIVSKPKETYRVIEIRPDCMILDGNQTFLLSKMEGDWPIFEKNGEDFILGGIYGTRFVEYLKLPRFDEFDRAPEVIAQHLQYAMQQMWSQAY